MTISFWLILLAVLAYGRLHTFLASLVIKAQTYYWFRSKTGQWFRITYNFSAVIILLPVLILPMLLIDKER